jgi:translation initiation factor IF-3
MNKSTIPPVCRIGNLGKMKYEASKKQKENRKHIQEVKTLKSRPCTQKHDLDIEVKHAREFLLKGDKVKLECRFRRREISFPKLGQANIEYIISQLEDIGKVEKNCELVMKSMVAILAPK